MDVHSTDEREKLIKRLRRVEGQVRGVQRMIDEGRDCREVIQQLSAVRSAIQQTGLEVMRIYAAQCLFDSDSETNEEELLDYLVTALGKWS